MAEEDLVIKEGITTKILRLPSAPVYMSIIKTLNGKPVGIPIWNSFQSIEARSMTNEAMSSTFLQLAKNISDLADTKSKDGKVIRVTLDTRSYNIFNPSPDAKLQISFVVVFEQTDKVNLKQKHREELTRLIVQSLKKNKKFRKYLDSEVSDQITKDHPLNDSIENDIAKVIIKWDDKRVEYLEKKAKEERERLKTLAKEEMKKQENVVEEGIEE